MEELSEVQFDLSKSFEYAFKGDSREAEFIMLSPPTMKQHARAAALKQSITKIVTAAVKDSSDDEDSEIDEESEITPQMIIGTIYSSSSVDANVVWEQAKALFKDGVALVDGEQKLTASLIEKMKPSDFEKMVGVYIANFTLASADP